MTLIKFGNLRPQDFAARVGAEFSTAEMDTLNHFWSANAKLSGPDRFHIFDDPAITIHVGSYDALPLDVFRAANARKPFTPAISVYVDNAWAEN